MPNTQALVNQNSISLPFVLPAGTPDTNALVAVTNADTTPGYLQGKLVAGTDIALTVLNPGGNEQYRISASNNPLSQLVPFVSFQVRFEFGSMTSAALPVVGTNVFIENVSRNINGVFANLASTNTFYTQVQIGAGSSVPGRPAIFTLQNFFDGSYSGNKSNFRVYATLSRDAVLGNANSFVQVVPRIFGTSEGGGEGLIRFSLCPVAAIGNGYNSQWGSLVPWAAFFYSTPQGLFQGLQNVPTLDFASGGLGPNGTNTVGAPNTSIRIHFLIVA